MALNLVLSAPSTNKTTADVQLITLALALGPILVVSVKRLDLYQYYVTILSFGPELNNIELHNFDQGNLAWSYPSRDGGFDISAGGTIEVDELAAPQEALIRARLAERGAVVASACLQFKIDGDSSPLEAGKDYFSRGRSPVSVALV